MIGAPLSTATSSNYRRLGRKTTIRNCVASAEAALLHLQEYGEDATKPYWYNARPLAVTLHNLRPRARLLRSANRRQILR